MNSKPDQNNDLILNSEEADIITLEKLINRIWNEENLKNNKEKPKKQLKSKDILNPPNTNSQIPVKSSSYPPVAPKLESKISNKTEILDITSLNHPPEISPSNSSDKKSIGNTRFAMMNELKEAFKKRGLNAL
ncbi:unnamed protein product [marine sediment metagenome]|uniref:Uncharacterized protein n=1 Tax=marine sediment metagenome TaxID=412755 RepID=X1D245_9ZZZZ